MQVSQSKREYDRALDLIPGGVNSPVRAFGSIGSHPIFIERGEGSRIYDVDGNAYVDYIGSWGPMILGHCHPAVHEAILQSLSKGLSFGCPTRLESELAALVIDSVTSVEMIRMVNSGTEACMSAIRLARAHTGKHKIVKFNGNYHGHADSLLVKAGSGVGTLGLPDSPGVPPEFTQHTLSCEFNDAATLEELVENHSGEIAAIILEPMTGNMGFVKPVAGFLSKLRAICDREGILLIFDEVMTGFRVALGGAQSLLNVIPDISVFGKVIGGGMPVGAYGGRKDIMMNVAPVGSMYQAGTLSGNPVAMTAGIATLREISKPGFYEDLGQKSAYLTDGMTRIANKFGHALSTDFCGGMFGYFFSKNEVRNYADAQKCNREFFASFYRKMLAKGVYLAPSIFEAGFVSAAHSDEDLDMTLEAFESVLESLVE